MVDWEVRKLGDVCEIFNGLWKGKKPPYIEVGVIRNTNFKKEGILDYSNIAYLPVEIEQYKKRKLHIGDIILEKSGGGPKQPVGRVVLFNKKEGDFSFSNFTSTIRILDDSIIDFNFLHKFLYFEYISGKTETMQRRSTGIRNLQLKEYKQIEIPIPPISEQLHIVAILNEAFENITRAKESAEQNLKNANEIFESYLQSVFENKGEGWEECNLEDYIKLIDYRGRTPVKTETGVRLITAKNVKLGHLNLEPQEFIHQDNYESWMTRGIPNFGDVIFTTEAPLANVAQINTKEKLAFAQRIIVMQPQKNKIDQTFLKYMLVSNPIRNKILEKGTGATVQGIKSKLPKKIRIHFLQTISEQHSIVAKLDALSAETKKLEAIYTQKLADLEELKKSILQKAFNGELK